MEDGEHQKQLQRHISDRALRNKSIISCDENDHREFVTGFYKGKKQRRKLAEELQDWKERDKRLAERKKALNEATQCMDVEDSVWDELLKRRQFKNAKVYKRQPFQYLNELGVIVGNDIAEGNAATTARETLEGNPMQEVFDVQDEEDIGFGIPLDSTADLDEDLNHSNQSTASGRGTPTSSSSRMGKRRKASMAGSLDVICETMKKIKDGLGNVHLHKMDKFDDDNVLISAYTALKSIPELSRGVFMRVYDTFVVQRERAKGFLLMNEEERVEWIAIIFGGL